jgi:hypothetical protein
MINTTFVFDTMAESVCRLCNTATNEKLLCNRELYCHLSCRDSFVRMLEHPVCVFCNMSNDPDTRTHDAEGNIFHPKCKARIRECNFCKKADNKTLMKKSRKGYWYHKTC